jgi:hypothetical protein
VDEWSGLDDPFTSDDEDEKKVGKLLLKFVRNEVADDEEDCGTFGL